MYVKRDKKREYFRCEKCGKPYSFAILSKREYFITDEMMDFCRACASKNAYPPLIKKKGCKTTA